MNIKVQVSYPCDLCNPWQLHSPLRSNHSCKFVPFVAIPIRVIRAIRGKKSHFRAPRFIYLARSKDIRMKMVSYLNNGHEQLAILVDGVLFDMETLHPDLPGNMNMFLNYWEDSFPVAQVGEQMVKSGRISKERGRPLKALNCWPRFLSPIMQRWLCISPACSSCKAKPESGNDTRI